MNLLPMNPRKVTATRWSVALLLIALTGGTFIWLARRGYDSRSALVDGKAAAASDHGNQLENEARLQPVFLGVDVGIGPLDDSLGPEFRRDIGPPRYTEEKLDRVIAFSRNASDYDEFCMAEARKFRTVFVFEPETGLYYVCVANRDGRWIAIPGEAGKTGEEVLRASKWKDVWYPSRVVSKTRLTLELKQGERREVYLER